MTAAPPALGIYARSLKIGSRTLVDDLRIEVPAGELHVLEGPNGSGKSFLLDVAIGLIRQPRTVAMLNGKRLEGDTYARWRAGLRRMFQTPVLPETISAGDLTSLSGADWENFGRALPETDPATRLGTLSYGYRRLAELIVAVAGSPRALLLDEPLAGVDAHLTEQMVLLISLAVRSGTAVLAVDHTGCLRNKLASQTYSWPVTQPTAALMEPILEPGISYLPRRLSAEIENFTLPGRTNPLVKDATLAIGAGELIVFTGPNGSGKSSLLRALADVPPRTWTGEVRSNFAGSGRIVLAPQPPKLIDTLTPLDNVRLMAAGSLTRADRRLRASLWQQLVSTGIPTTSLRSKAGNLSGGESAMVSLIGALNSDASLILLDEPTEALSSSWADAAVSLLSGAMRETGRSFIVASHDHRLISRIDGRSRVDLSSNHCHKSEWYGSKVP